MVRLLRVKRRRDLRRQRAQFGAVVATLFLGVAVFGATSDAYRNLNASYRELYAALRFADLTVTGGPVEELAGRAESARAVASIRTVADVPFEVGGSKLLGRVVGMPADAQPSVDRVQILSGTYLQPSRERGVLVEQHMASHFHLAPGDTVQVLGADGWVDVTVAGIAASAEYLWPARSRQEVLVPPDDFGVLFVPESLARQLAPASAGDQVAVYGAGPELVSDLARVARSNGALDIVPRSEQPSNAALQEDVSGFGELALLFPILFLAAAAMAAFVLLSRLVRSQRPEIGMLTANGFDRWTIFRSYLGYGILAGLAGGVLGAIGGLALGAWITHLYTSAISVPIAVIRLSWSTPLIGVGIAVLAGGLAGAAPARAAASVTPAEAMRGAMPSTARGASVIERLVPPVRRLPGRWRLAIRDIGRSRRRTVSTLVGVVLSLVLVLVSWGMLDTTNILLSRQFGTVQRQDAQLHFASGTAATSELSAARAVSGVAGVEPAAEFDASISRGDASYATTLLALPPDTTMHTFLLSGGGTGHLSGSGLLVGNALAGRIGVSSGDLVSVSSPAFPSPIRLPISGFVDEPLGTFAYVSLPSLEQVTGTGGLANTALLRFDPGANRSEVLDELRAMPDVAVVVDSRGLARSVGSLMGLFYVFVGVMLLFGALMSLALMFNTMSANVAERATELATLRAAGVGRDTIAGLLTRENLLVTAMGIVPGLLVGYLLAAIFMASFNSDLFTFTLHIRWTTLALSAAAMVVVALLSQWPGVRTVGRIDVARVVRERSV
jgi:putative ABC transport system permease protein